MRKYFSDEHLYNILLIFITVLFCCLILYGSLKLKVRVSAESLRGNEAQVEQLIGEYSEFYCKIDKDKNNFNSSFSSIELDNVLYFMFPSQIKVDYVVIDFYTSWDELLGTYSCDFESGYIYKIKGKELRAVKSDLPFVFIDIDSDEFKRVNDSYIHDIDKYSAEVEFLYQTQNEYYSVPCEIRPRGAASWVIFSHKSYTVKFPFKLVLLGLGKERKWNLVTGGHDRTGLKNLVFYHLAERLGLQFTPKIRVVNLYINGSYWGLYSLTTKVDSFCDDYLRKGDFLINWGSPNCKNKIIYSCSYDTERDEDNQAFYDVVWPETTLYNSEISAIVQEYVDTLESGGDIGKYIDLESFAKYYWVQEISMNYDAWSRSNYSYYLSRDKKFYAGPVWDLDLTLGAVGLGHPKIDFESPTGWKIRKYGYYKLLFNNQDFVDAVNAVYYKYDIPGLMEEMYQEFKSTSQSLAVEGFLYYGLWESEETNWADFSYAEGFSYNYYVEQKLLFLRERINWIKDRMER